MQKKRGFLLTIEGIDGSGKSSVAQALFKEFSQRAISCILTKEPGATPLGKYIRSIVQERPFDLCSKAEFLLFASDRAQHMCEVVEPALLQGNLVISDRMADSSLAYQGFGRGLNKEIIALVNKWAMNDRIPDLTLYIHVDYTTALKRVSKRNEKITAFESEKAAFFERVIEGFKTIFKERSNVVCINGNQPLGVVIAQATEIVLTTLENI